MKHQHVPLIKRVPIAKEVSSYWNKFKHEDGILITVESDMGIHHIHLTADTAISLRDMLTNAEQAWESAALERCNKAGV